MGMTEDDKRNCCLLEIQETEAKYYRTLEDIEKVGGARTSSWWPRGPLGRAVAGRGPSQVLGGPPGLAVRPPASNGGSPHFPCARSPPVPDRNRGPRPGRCPPRPPHCPCSRLLRLGPQLGPWSIPLSCSLAPSSLNWAIMASALSPLS